MKAPEIPLDESHRLDALRSLDILDTPPDPDFDAIVRLAQELFEVPICLISLIDADRQWFKACVGLEVSETPRAISFCGHAILQDEALVILDATRDERFADNPLVTGDPAIRFYAGMPIRLPSGYSIGTVCLIDRVPKAAFGERELRRLGLLAELAVGAMAVRGLRAELDSARYLTDRLRAAIQLAPSPIALVGDDGRVEEANAAFGALCRSVPPDGEAAAVLLAVEPEAWSQAATDAAGEAEVVTGTDGRRLHVVQEPGGLILVAGSERETP